MYPSISLHILGGFLLIITMFLLVIYFNKIQSFDIYNIIIILLVSSIAITLHSMSHLGLEKVYNYNPYNLFYESIVNVDAPYLRMKNRNMDCPCMKNRNMDCPCMKNGITNCPCMKTGIMDCPRMKKSFPKKLSSVRFQ